MSERNLNILITGATSGIGEALATYYAKSIAKNLFICGRDETRLFKVKKMCESLGCTVFADIIDVRDTVATKEWVEKCEKTARLNLVIANAGVATLDETPKNIYNTFAVNIFGVLNTITPAIEMFKVRKPEEKTENTGLDKFINKLKSQKKAFYVNPLSKIFMAKKGSELFNQDKKAIAIVSSIAGYHGLPSCPSYSASKACVKAYGEGIRGSLKPYDIKVSVICPGFVRSRITDKNTCPMPFFMEADKAAKIIAKGIEKNKPIIAFPWQIRFVTWFMSALPNKLSEIIYNRLPHKV